MADPAAVAAVPVPAVSSAPDRRWRRSTRWLLHTADGRSVLVLVLLPVALYVLPALFGHPAVAGDNAIQNFPLRVFTGQLLRQGHLPLWNPFIWSGSPLLGGLNAGAFYPFTFAFVVLPPIAAWVANLLVVYWAAGLGLYLLGRQLRLRPLPCLLAALTYSLAGTMSGQLVHLGVVQGMGWMPLLVFAQLRLSWAVLGTGPVLSDHPVGAPTPTSSGAWGPNPTPAVSDHPVGAPTPTSSGAWGPNPTPAVPDHPVGAPGGRSIWPWVTLLAAVVGLVALTGEPRSMAEAEVVGAVVTVWLVLRPYGGWAVTATRRLALVGWSVLAAAWGAATAAGQLLPGWSFINASQRASETFAYFGTGSLRISWTTLLLVPDLFGGDGLFGQPTYFNRYNLPEVVGYVGLLPLVAAFALATRSFGRRRDPRSSDWGLWLLLAVLGLLLTWGSFTPLGHLFVHIPLFGKTRLQSRNLGIVDLALAVLLAFWVDRSLGRRGAAAGDRAGGGDRAVAADRPAAAVAGEDTFAGWRRWVSAAPALGAAVLAVVVLAAPVAVEEYFGATADGAALGRQMTPWFAAQLVVAAAAAGLVLGWRRLTGTGRRRGVVAVVLVDLVLFLLSTSTGLTSGHTTLQPSTAQAAAVLGNDGRFAIYDTSALNVSDLSTIGQPDLNVLTKRPSVQGYGSILAHTYGTVTGTHSLDTLDPCALARGVFAPLRLATLLTLPQFLAPKVTAGQQPAAPAACPGAPAAGTAGRRTFYLGSSVTLSSASLVRTGPAAAGAGELRVGVVGPGGRTGWPVETVRTTAAGWTVRFATPQPAAGLVVTGPASSVSDTSVVDGTDGGRWALDGVLQQALGQPGWRYAGHWAQYGRFVRTGVPPPVWVAGAPAGSSATELSTTDWGTTVDRVTAAGPVTVVRSEAYMPGWRVQAVPVGGGPTRDLPVHRVGLVQGVRVPAGRWVLTFLYRPPGLNAGLAGSAVGLAGFVAVGVAALVRRRHRRGRGGRRQRSRHSQRSRHRQRGHLPGDSTA
ncbi:MAG TPA: hypothetical protein VHB02_09805 [Acidimicrobiales bacterium]|nr:hypothetical protein [Acidimicrobiales bacterium]